MAAQMLLHVTDPVKPLSAWPTHDQVTVFGMDVVVEVGPVVPAGAHGHRRRAVASAGVVEQVPTPPAEKSPAAVTHGLPAQRVRRRQSHNLCDGEVRHMGAGGGLHLAQCRSRQNGIQRPLAQQLTRLFRRPPAASRSRWRWRPAGSRSGCWQLRTQCRSSPPPRPPSMRTAPAREQAHTEPPPSTGW